VASVDGSHPDDPLAWGWRNVEASGYKMPVWQPQGDRVGPTLLQKCANRAIGAEDEAHSGTIGAIGAVNHPRGTATGEANDEDVWEEGIL